VAVLELVSRYHHDDGRPHRLVVASHPSPGDESASHPPSTTSIPTEEQS
jgi:hypothetical protein